MITRKMCFTVCFSGHSYSFPDSFLKESCYIEERGFEKHPLWEAELWAQLVLIHGSQQ